MNFPDFEIAINAYPIMGSALKAARIPRGIDLPPISIGARGILTQGCARAVEQAGSGPSVYVRAGAFVNYVTKRGGGARGGCIKEVK